jgi:hypothetical protein
MFDFHPLTLLLCQPKSDFLIVLVKQLVILAQSTLNVIGVWRATLVWQKVKELATNMLEAPMTAFLRVTNDDCTTNLRTV